MAALTGGSPPSGTGKCANISPLRGVAFGGEECAYLHPEKSQKDSEVQHVKGLPDGQTEVDGLGDVTNENKHLDSAQKKRSDKATKTVRFGYTVTCVTTSVRNKLQLEKIQTQNITKV